MFDNIGEKIKGLAKIIFWIEAIGAFMVGLVLAEATDGISMLIAVGGALVAWISSWFLYGFGEIIDKLCAIERNTRHGERKSVAQAKIETERIDKIEKLRSQGLITEEEYNKKRAEILDKL